MKFNDVLNMYLETLNCSSKKISKESGLSEPVISRYRSGERTPAKDSKQYKKLTNALFNIAKENGKNNYSLNKITSDFEVAFENDKAIRFLVLTPPEEKTVTEVYYDKDKPATVFVSAAVDTDSYLITSENCNITEFIVYGGVSEVAVDGKPVNFVKTDINENCSSVSVPAERWNSIKISRQV